METACLIARKSTHSAFIASISAINFRGSDLDQRRALKLARSWSGERRHIRQYAKQLLERSQAILYCCDLLIAKWNLLAHAQQILFAFQYQHLNGPFRAVVRAFGARHSMRASVKEIVGTIAVTKVIEHPRLLVGTGLHNPVMINKNFNRSNIAGKVTSLEVRFRYLRLDGLISR
jgi:hypothetical protein